MIDKIQNKDPLQLTDIASLQTLVVECMNVIESQSNVIAKQSKEIQELKDEINRMKGEHGSLPPKPKVSHATGQKPKIRPKRKPRKKRNKKANLIVDEIIPCPIDKSTLPPDAVFQGYKDLIEQDIVFKRHNKLYRVPVYHSKQLGRTYTGELPPSFSGQFGTDLKTWLQVFHHYGDMTQGRLHALMTNIGIDISTGTISNILLSNTVSMEQEATDILRSGLAHVDYAQMDGTKSFEAGQTKATQIICTPLYSVYKTMDNKSRASVIGALQAKLPREIPLLYDATAIDLLKASKVPKKDQRLLGQLLELDQIYTVADFEKHLSKKAPHLLKKESHAKVLAILALNYYQGQADFPIPQRLLTDAGHEYSSIVLFQILCWIHEERHYKKMVPILKVHQDQLELVRCQIWEYYKKLLDFKELTLLQQKEQREKLDQEFDEIFSQQTIYKDLNKRLEKTFSRKEKLLQILQFPKVPLHNNAAELAVRRKARKRDISLHTMSAMGTRAQDAFMSVVETAAKLGVNVFEYLRDLLSQKRTMIPLADLIMLRSR